MALIEVDLLDGYRRGDKESVIRPEILGGQIISELKTFGKRYFDGERQYGYGGYYYDGRWKPVAQRFIDFYNLTNESKVLDVGCTKGYLLFELKELLPGIEVTGIDISEYAIENAKEEIKCFLKIAGADNLPFIENTFDLVISIGTIHNLPLEGLKKSLKEFERVSRKYKSVASYLNERQKQSIKNWGCTVETILNPEEYLKLFEETSYTGDYYWFLVD